MSGQDDVKRRLRSVLRSGALQVPALERLLRERNELRARSDQLARERDRSQAELTQCAQERDQLREMLGHPPGHYYSPIPSFSDLARRAERIWGPPPAEIPGVDLNLEGQLALLSELARYSSEQPFSDSPQGGLRYHFDNNMYGTADGIVLYTMLRHLQPRRVIEIGSGYTSALMLDTLGADVELTFIDPEPQRLRSLFQPGDEARATVIPRLVQDVEREMFTSLQAGDLLFVDSSHVTKIGSDVNLIVFELLPRIAAGVYVHVHDAFYPFEYPRSWVDQRWAWNELYLVRAFLEYNRSFEVVLWPSYLEVVARDTLADKLPLAVTQSIWPDIIGAALWLRKVADG